MLPSLVAALFGVLVVVLAVAVLERRRGLAARAELARLRDHLSTLERRGAQSGPYNSRHFVETLTREIERARTYGRPVSLALAAVEELRDPEAAADEELLRTLGGSIGGSVRALDVACRVGTSEFGVVLPETDARAAGVAAERILRSIARAPWAEGRPPRAAIGIASCPASAGSFEELVERAGSALRSARRAARPGPGRAGAAT